MERCWVRINGFENDIIFGELLNEPIQNFGCNKGDQIAFIALSDEKGNVELFADLSDEYDEFDNDDENKYSEDIETAVHLFKEDQTEENKLRLL